MKNSRQKDSPRFLERLAYVMCVKRRSHQRRLFLRRDAEIWKFTANVAKQANWSAARVEIETPSWELAFPKSAEQKGISQHSARVFLIFRCMMFVRNDRRCTLKTRNLNENKWWIGWCGRHATFSVWSFSNFFRKLRFHKINSSFAINPFLGLFSIGLYIYASYLLSLAKKALVLNRVEAAFQKFN